VAVEHDVRLELRSDPRLLGAVRCLVRTWLRSEGVAAEVADEATLAVDEACANAIRHAYCWQCDEIVVLTLRSGSELLEVEVRDQGVPCPPEHLQEGCRRTADVDHLEPGGLGLGLIHQVFDEVRFTAGRARGNSVVMRLRRPQRRT
jgi:anti-sigma regulatory factor (Ser/Thr protein kinase)